LCLHYDQSELFCLGQLLAVVSKYLVLSLRHFVGRQMLWFRAFSTGIGALSIGTSIYVTNSRMFGIIFPIRTLFIVLLIYGIGMIVYGVTGKLSLDEILKKKFHSTRDE
jgi:hypothetical protein